MKKNEQDKNKVRELRDKSKKKYSFLFNQVAEILYRHDPIYLAECGAPSDEYEGETSQILPQLKSASSVLDTRKIIYDVFNQSFNYGYSRENLTKLVKLGNDAGNETDYQQIAEEVWVVWKKFKSESQK